MYQVLFFFLVILSFSVRSEVLDLTEETFSSVVSENTFVLVEFYAPWCGYCKRFEPDYLKIGKEVENEYPETNLVIARVDCQQYTTICYSEGIGRYPTMKFYTQGSGVLYNSDATYDSVKKFLVVRTQTPEQRAYTVTNYVYLMVQIGSQAPQRLVFSLYGEKSPKSVSHFMTLIREGAYEGGDFSRSVPDLLAQGRVSNEKESTPKIPFNERNIPLDYGVLAFTDTGVNLNDFFISLTSAHWLDGTYDVFGLLIGGFDVLKQISQTQVEIVHVRIVEAGEFSDYKPSQARQSYQIAASYARAGNLRKAYEFYDQRTSEEGWKEEIADSYYQMALISESLGTADWETLHSLFRHSLAFSRQPEPLYRISLYYYLQGQNGVAYTYADECCDIKNFENNQHPFADETIYRLARWDLLASTAYSASQSRRGLRAAEECVRQKPEEQRYQDNLSFYQSLVKKESEEL